MLWPTRGAKVMAINNVERLTLMEAKILVLSKSQYDKGYSEGSFTPGFIRKETEYGYRAINMALKSLIDHGLVEKNVTSTFREGAPVELDVYIITERGLQAIEKMKSGAIKVNGGEPAGSSRSNQPRDSYRPEERREPRFRPEERREPTHNHELAQSIKNLEAAMEAITADIKDLHGKVDMMLAHTPAKSEVKIPAAQTKQRKPRTLSPNALIHRVLVLDVVNELRNDRDNVLAEDVKAMYFKKCKERKLSPKGPTQFTTFLKRVQHEQFLSLKKVGCRNLGIKGRGSRLVVEFTREGEELLAKHGQSILHPEG